MAESIDDLGVVFQMLVYIRKASTDQLQKLRRHRRGSPAEHRVVPLLASLSSTSDMPVEPTLHLFQLGFLPIVVEMHQMVPNKSEWKPEHCWKRTNRGTTLVPMVEPCLIKELVSVKNLYKYK